MHHAWRSTAYVCNIALCVAPHSGLQRLIIKHGAWSCECFPFFKELVVHCRHLCLFAISC